MNLAYKHLDSKLRVADLSLGQWIAVLCGVVVAVGWGLYVSPLGASLTLMTSVYIAAVPAVATLFASLTEFDPWLLVRAAVGWRRLQGRFVPGPGTTCRGYVVRDEQADERHGHVDAGGPHARVDLDALWEAR